MLEMVDAEEGLLGLEWIDGWSLREVLGGGAEGEDGEADDLTEEQSARRAEAEGALQSIGVSKGKRRLRPSSPFRRRGLTSPPALPLSFQTKSCRQSVQLSRRCTLTISFTEI